MEPVVAVPGPVVEALQPVDPVLVARGDAIEVVFEARREVVVDELWKCCSSRPVTAKARNVGTRAVPFLKT